ncbi:MAG TPA: 23S rRNA (adenine(2503)-C(2))-methyltransferase RlmN [Rubricoccaceae bacterium]|nr:23S rRNA (adenine(2503)-C(2))-methyltransferase RlmN [Rubricoccaceae bacterium]
MASPALKPHSLVDLVALDREGMGAFVETLGEPRYRGRQLFRWVHARGAASFDEMTDLPKALREKLKETATLGTLQEVTRRTARDETIKVLFALPSGRRVEGVLIPDLDDETGEAKRLTVCVSSQVGCAMGCHFCATGLMGFSENLTAGQIAGQVRHLDALARERFGKGVTNVVYMGMGEPLQNYDAVVKSTEVLTDPDGLGLSPKRITVSTVGLARRIRQFADDQAEGRAPAVGLAVSLHAPTDVQRSAIMPVNRSEKTDLQALRDAIAYFYRRTKRRITFEYCLFAGVNDSEEDARNLAKAARWAPTKVNLIMYNPVEGTPFRSPDEARLQRFIRVLVDEGVTVTVRRSRGQDIEAACGQLAVLDQVDGS